jgi:hypothetical protein
MIKYLLVSAVVYFILSRYVFQSGALRERTTYTSEKNAQKENNSKGDYVDYEEVE